MTAMNAFGRPDGAWLLSDSAWFAADGTVLLHQPKTLANERLRVAIGCNGVTLLDFADDVRPWLSRQRDTADVLANLPALVAEIKASMHGADYRGHPEGFRLTLAYWDDERAHGRIAMIGSNTAMGNSIGREPFEVRNCSENFTPRLDPSPWPGVGDFDPRRDGKRLAELQREARHSDGTFRVGGTFTALRVHAGGIERFEIARWRDPIGRKIGERRSWLRWPASIREAA